MTVRENPVGGVASGPRTARSVQAALIQALSEAGRLEPGLSAEVFETHISWVLLAGQHAWKIKKAVDLGFLDFSTLALRRHFCEEELRLNRRLASGLYLDVAAIRGTPDMPRLDALDAAAEDSHAFEYAVRMVRFPQSALADRMLASGAFLPSHLDGLAVRVARFHQAAARAKVGERFGLPASVMAPARDNFETLRRLGLDREGPELEKLAAWTREHFDALAGLMAERHRAGFVRECHGDLHLGNLAVVDGEALAFDGIEFSPDLRWVDIMNEVAFLLMDLAARGRPDYGARFLNGWLEAGGDYGGLPLLAWYQVYRALVRAKVAAIRGWRPGEAPAAAALAECRRYLHLADGLSRPRRPALIITRGYSGSGKTTATQGLVESLQAVRLRSDVARKRMGGLAPTGASASAPGCGLYTEDMGRATYAELERLARLCLSAGYPAIVDATFLLRRQRDAFRRLAEEMTVPFLLLDCRAEADELRRRVARRLGEGTDASEATEEVLALQMRGAEALAADESAFAMEVDTGRESVAEIGARVGRRLAGAGNAMATGSVSVPD